MTVFGGFPGKGRSARDPALPCGGERLLPDVAAPREPVPVRADAASPGVVFSRCGSAGALRTGSFGGAAA